MPTRMTAELAIRAEAEVGEGPVWDVRLQALVWVDLDAGIVHVSNPATGSDEEIAVTGTVGAVAPRTGDGWAAAVEDGFGYISQGGLELVERTLPDPDHRMNDAKCDPMGRLWAGSTTFTQQAGAGALHVWEGTGPSRVAISGLTLPNGIGWSPDGATLYLAESAHHTVYEAPFDASSGVPGRLRPILRVPHAFPDGLAVADDGTFWLALWGAGEVWRVAPDGTVLTVVSVPATRTSSCAIGPDGTLYITSARRGLSGTALRDQPLAGSVFALSSGTRPVPLAPFSG